MSFDRDSWAPPDTRNARDRRDREGTAFVMRHQCGDPEAFAGLYRLYFADVHAYMCMMLGDEAEAEDVTQQVFVKALKALPSYEPRGRGIGGWLFAVARNAGVDALRARRSISADPVVVNGMRERSMPHHDHHHEGDDYNLSQLVEMLPRRQREVIVLRYRLGLSLQETALVLGTPIDSVNGLQYRALARLEQALAIAKHPASGRKPRRRARRLRPLIVPA